LISDNKKNILVNIKLIFNSVYASGNAVNNNCTSFNVCTDAAGAAFSICADTDESAVALNSPQAVQAVLARWFRS